MFEKDWEKVKLDQINQIKKSRSRERNKLDNILLTLSAGTLSLSATFVGKFARNLIDKEFLFASWSFLILGLFGILLAYIFAELHFKYYESGVKNDLFKSVDEAESNWRNKLVDIFNLFSFVAIVIGISIFVYFAYLNIK